jgi:hypothetical protein
VGARKGTDLASLRGVRRLEARFHPHSRSDNRFVVVGHIVCDESGPRIEPADIPAKSAKPFDSARLHEKLAFLVLSTAGEPCRSLLSLRSGYWSFVEISPPGEQGAA